jgi:hypothetical protein
MPTIRSRVDLASRNSSGDANMQDFIDLTRTGDLTHLLDPDSELWVKFGVEAQEHLVLIDADGEVLVSGIVRVSELREQLP